MRRGDKGSEVKELQKKLVHIGWDIDETGLFDYQTEAAVWGFQHEEQLSVDGIVGRNTEASLTRLALRPEADDWTDPFDWIYDDMEWLSQRDNEENPSETCGPTSLATVARHKGTPSLSGKQLEDEITRLIRTKKFPNIHRGMVWAAKQYGYDAKFVARTWEQIRNFGIEHGPLITAGAFTNVGHIVVICGMTKYGHLVVHDPWGHWTPNGYTSKKGAFRIYDFNDMKKVLQAYKGDYTKAWVHEITEK